jgi:hypothetical protein
MCTSGRSRGVHKCACASSCVCSSLSLSLSQRHIHSVCPSQCGAGRAWGQGSPYLWVAARAGGDAGTPARPSTALSGPAYLSHNTHSPSVRGWLGRLSLSLYLCHMLLLVVVVAGVPLSLSLFLGGAARGARTGALSDSLVIVGYVLDHSVAAGAKRCNVHGPCVPHRTRGLCVCVCVCVCLRVRRVRRREERSASRPHSNGHRRTHCPIPSARQVL